MAAKSKAKVNTKFVLILIVAMGTVTFVLGALWYLQQRYDATRNLARADRLIAEGNYDAAFQQLGRALGKEPTNREHLVRMHAVLDKMRPETSDRAAELHKHRVSLYQHGVTYRPEDPEVHMELVNELYNCARFLAMPNVWEEVVTATDHMDRHLRPEDPARLTARLYRGLANMELRAKLTPDQVSEAQADIQAFVDANPTDDLGWASLVRSYLLRAQDYANGGQKTRERESLAKADELLPKAAAAVPNGPEVAMLAALRLQYERDETRQGDARAQAAVDHIAETARASTDPLQVITAARVLQVTGGENGCKRGAQLLKPLADAQPERLDLRLTQGNMHYFGGELDEADQCAIAVLDAPWLPVSYLSRFQRMLQEQAGTLLVDTAFQRWERATEAERGPIVRSIEEARARLAARIPQQQGNLSLARADGKLAYARGDYQTAAANFEEVVKATNAAEPDALIYSSLSLDRINQTGQAIQRMKGAIVLRPRAIGLLQEMARMQFNTKEYDGMKETLQNIERFEPQNVVLLDLQDKYEQIMAKKPGAMKGRDPVVDTIARADKVASEGDEAGARQILLEAHRSGKPDVRLLERLFQMEMRAQNSDQAKAYLAEAMRLSPNNPGLERLTIILDTTDPIDRLERMIDMDTAPPAERTATKAINLFTLARMQRAEAQDAEQAGELEAAAAAKALAERATTRAEEFRKQVAVNGEDHGRVLDHLYSQALLDKNFAGAEAMMPRLIALNIDKADGLIIKGRYELARGLDQEAVKTLGRAVEKKDWASDGWRLLGLAYSRLGNNSEAQRCYETSFQRNPADVEMVKLYVGLLIRMGDQSRALRILRKAHSMAPNDEVLREGWLDMEQQYGDQAAALEDRRERYRQRPEDRANAIALAQMLAENRPMYFHILDAKGNPKFTPDLWIRTDAANQQKMLDEVKVTWDREAERILAALMATGEEDLMLANLRATLAFTRGQPLAGEKVFREFLAKQERSAITTEMLFTLAEYQKKTGRDQATVLATLEEARQYQDDKVRDADKALGDAYGRAGRFDKALEAYQRVLEVRKDRLVQMGVVEATYKLGRIDEAIEMLKSLEREGEDFASTVMRSMLLETQGNELLAKGKAEAAALTKQGKAAEAERAMQARTNEAEAKFTEQRVALDAARRLEPNNPMTLLQRAKSYIAAYRRTQQQSDSDEAQQSLNEAEKLRADFPPLVMLQADFWLAKGDLMRAISKMSDYVFLRPDDVNGRETLINLHMNNNNPKAAIQVAEDGTRRNPAISTWWEALGNLHFSQRSWAACAAALTKAYQIKPQNDMLGRVVSCLLAQDPPDHQRAISLLTERKGIIEETPVMRGLYAVSLSGADRREEAMAQIKLAYREYRKIIADAAAAPPQVDAEGKPVPPKATPNDIGTWFVSVRQMFRAEEAQKVEDLLMELCGGKPDAFEYKYLGVIWVAMGESGHSRAIELQKLAVENCPQDDAKVVTDMHADLAQYYVAARSYRNAADTLKKLAARPGVVGRQRFNVCNDLAYLLATEMDSPDEALPYAQQAVEAFPNDAAGLDTMATIAMKLADRADVKGDRTVASAKRTEAKQLLEKAIGTGQTSADIYLHYGQVLHALGNAAEAEAALQRGLLADPSDAKRAEIKAMIETVKTKRK